MAGQIEAAGWLRPYDESGTAVTHTGGRGFRWIPASVPALFADLAGMRPDVDAVIDLGARLSERDGWFTGARGRLTYARLWERAQRVAGGLAAGGVRPGDRVAIRLPNGMDWCLAFLGAQAAGAVAVPVNTRFSDAEAGFVASDCGASVAIGPGDQLPDGPPLVRECAPDGLGALFYTSGTTGRPKGAMLTHRAMLSAAESARRALELSWLPEQDIRNLVPAPLFHVMGSLVQWLPTCLAGGTTVLMPAFDAGQWLRAIEAERISVLTAVPAMYWLAMRRPEFATANLGSVRRVGYGAAPTPPAQVSRLMKVFPTARLCPGYGLTETCGIVSGLPHDYALRHADAVGFAMPATDIALASAGPDGAAELLVRGPQLMSGYWNRPAATARALSGGWLHTGDIARITGDGAIKLLDRRDDVVTGVARTSTAPRSRTPWPPTQPSPRSRSSESPTTHSAGRSPPPWSRSPTRRSPPPTLSPSPAPPSPISRSRSTSPSAPTHCRATPAARSSSPRSATRPLGPRPLVTFLLVTLRFVGRHVLVARGGTVALARWSSPGPRSGRPAAVREVTGNLPEAANRAGPAGVDSPDVDAGDDQWLTPVGAFVAGHHDGLVAAGDQLLDADDGVIGPGPVPQLGGQFPAMLDGSADRVLQGRRARARRPPVPEPAFLVLRIPQVVPPANERFEFTAIISHHPASFPIRFIVLGPRAGTAP